MSEAFNNQQIDEWEDILSKELDSQTAPILTGDAKRFIATIKAIQRRVEWTTSKPDKPGWYWLRYERDLGEYIVWISSDLRMCKMFMPYSVDIPQDGEWSKIEPPHEARG